MKKLIITSAAVVAGALFSGNAFAIPSGAAQAIDVPTAAVKVSCGCYRPRYHHRRHTQCCGTYSLYTYAAPCYSGCGCGCGVWRCGGYFGGVFGW